MTIYIGRTANQRKVTKWLSFQINVSQYDLKSNHHILDVYDHIHAKDEVSMSVYLDRRTYERKVPKWLPFEN